MLSRALEAGASKVAEEVLSDYGLTSAPISPFAIAERAGITVKSKESDQPGVSGFLLHVENNFGIMYADHIKNEGFINFTVAHELGHYFLPGHPEQLFPNKNGLHCSHSGFQSTEEHEREADFFATALLMPRALFRRAMERREVGFDAIEKMAAEFVTSITATAIRYAQFTPDPVAVIISSGGTIEYGFLSDSFREVRGCQRSLKGCRLSPSTATARFNKNMVNVR